MFDTLKLGPCSLEYGDLQINLTEGGVTLHIEPELKDMKADQFGTGPVDHRITGWNIRAIVPLAQTDYETLKQAAVFLTEGIDGLTDRQLGASMRNLGKQLTLHPLEVEGTDEDVVFFLAAPITAMELSYSYDDQRVYNVEFFAYPKDGASAADEGNYLTIGGTPVTRYALTFEVRHGGAPLPGATVKIAGFSSTRTTDASGDLVYNLPDGDYFYAVEHPGFDTVTGVATVDGIDLAVPVTIV